MRLRFCSVSRARADAKSSLFCLPARLCRQHRARGALRGHGVRPDHADQDIADQLQRASITRAFDAELASRRLRICLKGSHACFGSVCSVRAWAGDVQRAGDGRDDGVVLAGGHGLARRRHGHATDQHQLPRLRAGASRRVARSFVVVSMPCLRVALIHRCFDLCASFSDVAVAVVLSSCRCHRGTRLTLYSFRVRCLSLIAAAALRVSLLLRR